MDGSTIPYYVVEERKKLNRCIEEAPKFGKNKLGPLLLGYSKYHHSQTKQKREKQKIRRHWDTKYVYDTEGRYIYSSE